MRSDANRWALKDNVFHEDAEAIRRLKAAGANVFGKTNVPISLVDFQSYNDVYGTTNNPFDHSKGSGGSSGVAAFATAAASVHVILRRVAVARTLSLVRSHYYYCLLSVLTRAGTHDTAHAFPFLQVQELQERCSFF